MLMTTGRHKNPEYQWPWRQTVAHPSAVVRVGLRECVFVEHHKVLSLRCKMAPFPLDEGATLWQRERNSRTKGLHHPYGLEHIMQEWLERLIEWAAFSLSSSALSFSTTSRCSCFPSSSPSPSPSRFSSSPTIVCSCTSSPFRYYASQLLAVTLSSLLFQPFRMLTSFQVAQLEHPISLRQAYSLARSVPDKSLWDGLAASVAHRFLHGAVDDLLYCSVLNLYGLQPLPPAHDHCLWAPSLPLPGLHTAARRSLFRWYLRSLVSRTSSLLASLLASPLHTLRLRLETQGSTATIPVRWLGPSASLSCLRDLSRLEGPSSLFRGTDHQLYGYLQDLGILTLIASAGAGLLSFSLNKTYFGARKDSLITTFFRFLLSKPPLDEQEIQL